MSRETRAETYYFSSPLRKRHSFQLLLLSTRYDCKDETEIVSEIEKIEELRKCIDPHFQRFLPIAEKLLSVGYPDYAVKNITTKWLRYAITSFIPESKRTKRFLHEDKALYKGKSSMQTNILLPPRGEKIKKMCVSCKFRGSEEMTTYKEQYKLKAMLEFCAELELIINPRIVYDDLWHKLSSVKDNVDYTNSDSPAPLLMMDTESRVKRAQAAGRVFRKDVSISFLHESKRDILRICGPKNNSDPPSDIEDIETSSDEPTLNDSSPSEIEATIDKSIFMDAMDWEYPSYNSELDKIFKIEDNQLKPKAIYNFPRFFRHLFYPDDEFSDSQDGNSDHDEEDFDEDRNSSSLDTYSFPTPDKSFFTRYRRREASDDEMFVQQKTTSGSWQPDEYEIFLNHVRFDDRMCGNWAEITKHIPKRDRDQVKSRGKVFRNRYNKYLTKKKQRHTQEIFSNFLEYEQSNNRKLLEKMPSKSRSQENQRNSINELVASEHEIDTSNIIERQSRSSRRKLVSYTEYNSSDSCASDDSSHCSSESQTRNASDNSSHCSSESDVLPTRQTCKVARRGCDLVDTDSDTDEIDKEQDATDVTIDSMIGMDIDDTNDFTINTFPPLSNMEHSNGKPLNQIIRPRTRLQNTSSKANCDNSVQGEEFDYDPIPIDVHGINHMDPKQDECCKGGYHENDLNHIFDRFNKYSKTYGTCMSKDEFHTFMNALRQSEQTPMSEGEISEVFARIDTNQDEEISFLDLILYLHRKGCTDNYLKELLSKFTPAAVESGNLGITSMTFLDFRSYLTAKTFSNLEVDMLSVMMGEPFFNGNTVSIDTLLLYLTEKGYITKVRVRDVEIETDLKESQVEKNKIDELDGGKVIEEKLEEKGEKEMVKEKEEKPKRKKKRAAGRRKRRRIEIDNDSTELSSKHIKNMLKDTSDIVQQNRVHPADWVQPEEDGADAIPFHLRSKRQRMKKNKRAKIIAALPKRELLTRPSIGDSGMCHPDLLKVWERTMARARGEPLPFKLRGEVGEEQRAEAATNGESFTK